MAVTPVIVLTIVALTFLIAFAGTKMMLTIILRLMAESDSRSVATSQMTTP